LTLILHIATREDWEKAQSKGVYKTKSLEKQGFIHCAYPDQLVKVANLEFRGQKDLVLLLIESNRVHSKIREAGSGAESYPYIYGPLNLDSVSKTVDYGPNEKGEFELPSVLA
jgi:uncharacterized protein (DUF952 family)